jgi:hypothetical protein
MIPHLWTFSKNCLRLPILILSIGCTHIVRSTRDWSKYFTLYSRSIEIFDFAWSWSYFNL